MSDWLVDMLIFGTGVFAGAGILLTILTIKWIHDLDERKHKWLSEDIPTYTKDQLTETELGVWSLRDDMDVDE